MAVQSYTRRYDRAHRVARAAIWLRVATPVAAGLQRVQSEGKRDDPPPGGIRGHREPKQMRIQHKTLFPGSCPICPQARSQEASPEGHHPPADGLPVFKNEPVINRQPHHNTGKSGHQTVDRVEIFPLRYLNHINTPAGQRSHQGRRLRSDEAYADQAPEGARAEACTSARD